MKGFQDCRTTCADREYGEGCDLIIECGSSYTLIVEFKECNIGIGDAENIIRQINICYEKLRSLGYKDVKLVFVHVRKRKCSIYSVALGLVRKNNIFYTSTTQKYARKLFNLYRKRCR